MDSAILATSISANQKGKQPKSVIKSLLSSLAQLGMGPHPMLLPFQLYDANLSSFMSYVNFILNHLVRIEKSVYWISFCRI